MGVGVGVGLLCIGCFAEVDIVPEVVVGNRIAAEVIGTAGRTVAVTMKEGHRTARCCYMSDEAVLEEAEKAEEAEMQKPIVGAGWSYHLYKDWMQGSSAGQVCLC
jgi:hypothetical protein